jgi:thiol-disulfide isomerase/thioredoxin
MKNRKLYNKTTKYLLIVLLGVILFGLIYLFVKQLSNYESKQLQDPQPFDKVDGMMEAFTAVREKFNSGGSTCTKKLVIYTADWCPHCRSFMGKKKKEDPISEDSDFARVRNALKPSGNFEHVMDTDPLCQQRMTAHGIGGYPGFALVDKNTDEGTKFNCTRKSDEIIAKFNNECN